MQIVKVILFITLCVGYYLYVKRKNIVKDEFIPIILISSISLVIYIAGILNLLEITTWVIGIIGNVLFIKEIYAVIKNKENIISGHIILLLLMFLWAVALLKDAILTHYDNFSHWAMIIREMLLTDKLPNFESTLIMFSSYPPGTACTVYFICKYIGTSEDIMLFAQAILLLTSLYTLFAFCKKKNKINYIIVIIAMIYLLAGNIFIDELLVDTALPIVGIAALAIILYYKDDSKKGLMFSIPVLTLLIIIKNSGIFFVVIDIAVWMLFLYKNTGFKQIFKTKYILLIFIPMFALVIWNAHTDLVFKSDVITKHSMSIENYIQNFSCKDNMTIYTIFLEMIGQMTDISNRYNQILLVILPAYIIMICLSLKNKELRNIIVKMFIVYIVTYILYQLGLFGMYLFSMPTGESLDLAGYYRYFLTVVLFNFGNLVITLLNFFNVYATDSKYKNIICKLVLLIIIAMPLILNRGLIRAIYTKPVEGIETRNLILSRKNMYNIEEGKSYLIYLSKNSDVNQYYLYYIAKYDFRSANINVIRDFSELEGIYEVFEYDYFIIIEKDESVEEFLSSIGKSVDTSVIKLKENYY